LIKLIGKILLFAFIGIMMMLPVCLWSSHAYKQLLAASAINLRKDTNILIAGDSHAEATVNPVLLPHSVNIAKSAENYFFSYYKIRHFLEKNPQISVVVLGCSWHNFPRNFQESYIFGAKLYSMESYFPLLDQFGKEIIKSRKSTYLVPWCRYTLGLPLQLYLDKLLHRKLLGLSLGRQDFMFFGGYRALSTTNIDPVNINKKLQRYYQGSSITDADTSPYMIEYLYKIVRLCSDRNIKLVLINSPVHNLYRQGVPVSATHDLERLQAHIKAKFNNVEYLNLSNYQLPDQYFYDGDHLNKSGADIITKYLAAMLGNL